ncbi:type VI secretion system protein TssA [Agarilytica rhodophyticola]|uniref:type VI secretion system protein TssA n=1 Tax=Agarilytica rhodophyticola TaxID=1737490 RepID=UPI000B3433D1|nr:type VI secretion system protein TssA [Agarilytica rhodophyticola]
MASQQIIDVESLLQPISEDSPTGDDIREDRSATSQYQIIKSERNQARAAERQSIHDGESTEAAQHWQKITELAPQIIQENSKDLEVASWYAEAMIRRYGFAGLRDAFSLIQGLLENFWENLHPMPDEYGIETRVSCLSGLNGEGAEGVMIAPIRKVQLTEGENPGPYSLWQYHQALDIQKAPDEEARQAKIASLGFDLDEIDKSVTQSSETFYVDIRDDIESCIEIYKSVGLKLDELCGIHEAPPTRTIVEILTECLGVVNHIGKLKLPTEAGEVENDAGGESAGGENAGAAATQQVVVAKGPIANRDDAFKQLIEIAEFFRKTEPHSPVSYVLQKAVKWGNMPLGDLINELIPDNSSREHFSELTGVECEE